MPSYGEQCKIRGCFHMLAWPHPFRSEAGNGSFLSAGLLWLDVGTGFSQPILTRCNPGRIISAALD